MKTENSANGESVDIEWKIKSDKHAMTFDSRSEQIQMEYQLLIDDKKEKVFFLTENNQKFAMEIPYSYLDAKDVNLPLNSRIRVDSKNEESVAGIPCVKLTIIAPQQVVEVWVSKDAGLTPSDFPNFMSGGALMSLLKYNNIDGVPLKFIVRNIAGDVLNMQEIISINETSHSDNSFEIPSGFELRRGQ